MSCSLLQSQETPLVRTQATEVVVDVVVRDKKGKLMRGIPASEFTVTEDGVPQPIRELREVSGFSVEEGVADARRKTTDPTKRVQLFTLVFDRLGIDSRRLAKQAAMDLLKEELPANVYFAVFYTDLHLKVLQAFTSDRAKLRGAVERATSGAMTDYANSSSDLKLAVAGTTGSESSANASSNSGGQSVDGGSMAAAAMNRMVTDMLDFSENSAREQQGRSSIFALWGIVKEQKRFPGRKTLLYFSEGLQLPNALQNQFRNMISDANRSNVSVYALDARGLSVANDNQLGQDMMNRNLSVSAGQYRTSQTGEQMSREQIMQFDRALDSIRSNPQVALAELAESTGGFLIANTNDFRQPVRRLAEDLGSHYELVYRPVNGNLDGKFRSIDVKVNRSEAKIQARSGYFALPSIDGQNVFPYEVPLLTALAQKPLPRGLEFRTSVVPYRPLAGEVQSMIIFDMPMKDVTFRENAEKTAYRTHFTFLALIKDAQGQVVGKVSRDLPMDEPIDRLKGFQQGRAIFSKAVKLRPGRYVLESAVADLESEKIAARRVSVVIPGRPENAVSLSGLVLVRRTDQPPATPEPDDPFLAAGNRVIPTLIDAVPGGKGNALSIYFCVYPIAGSGEKPEVTMEFYQSESKLGGGALELPAAKDGRIPYMATTPLDGFQRGQYEVRVTARQNGTTDVQSLFVTIE